MPVKQNNLLGITFAVMAVTTYSIMDIMVAYLVRQDYPTSQVMFFRSACSIPFALGFVIYSRELKNLRSKRPVLQILRCVAGAMAMFLAFHALGKLDVATVTALWSVNPIIVTVISFLFLGEKVGVHRWSAVVIGFVGVLIISPPQTFNINVAIPLLASLCMALSVAILRTVGRSDSAPVSTLYFAITATAVALMLNIGTEWKSPSTLDTVLLVSTALVGTISMLMLTYALRIAEASLVMPVDYFGIIILTVLAYFFFQEVPSWQTIIGAILIIIAGMYTVYREIHRKKTT